MKYRPTLLLILDGWGVREDGRSNAIQMASPQHMTQLAHAYPSTVLEASGESVGLPEGLMGNSEVGHLNIGAGRVVYQDILRITNAIKDGSFFRNKAFLDLFSFAKTHQGRVHLMGLVSEGGVHSSLDHLLALIELAARERFQSLFLHCFLDGRDTPPKSALHFVAQVEASFKTFGVGKTASVSGRYYAMDRDNRWERVEKAYRAMVLGDGRSARSPNEAIEIGYERGETDEFVLPTVLLSKEKPIARIEDGDGVIFFNFRADRARQLTRALTDPNFSGFRLPQPKIAFCSMTQYEASCQFPVAFPPEHLVNTLSEVWSQEGLHQFHAAETEKYAHVTYFFNGGREDPFKGEDRLLIPSPKVATYDLEPEMSASLLTDACLTKIAENKYDCYVVNFANPDMVGHTGNLEATVKGVQVVDACVGRLAEAILARDGLLVITADHGNAEIMYDPKTNQPHTAHTTSPVPLIFVGKGLAAMKCLPGGILADIAPTLLLTQKLRVPGEMTGKSLF